MFFDIAACLILAIILTGTVLYPTATMFLARGRKLPSQDHTPQISIIIPACNEEGAIAAKIENTLAIDYQKDKYEIIVANSESSDRTAAIARGYPVKVVDAPKGKVRALNAALREARFEIAAITDADTTISANSLRSMVSHLTGDVGVTVGYVIADESIARDTKKYREADWRLREAEGLIDSACNSDGKFLLFKRSLLDSFPEDLLSDDYYMTLFIRRKGYRIVVDKDARVQERMPASVSDEIAQFRRYARDILITNVRNIDMLFNPRYGYYGMATLPFRRFFPMLYPLFLAYLLIYCLLINYYLALIALIAGAFLCLRRNIMFFQLYAVFLSYFDLFTRKGYGGIWNHARR